MVKEKHSYGFKDYVGLMADIVVLPATFAAGAYTFCAKTSDALYDNLKNLGKLSQGINNDRQVFFENADFGAETAKKLKDFHQKWTKTYNQELHEMGFTSLSKKFGGLHSNQKMEIIVQSVAAGALVVGLWAMLDQLRDKDSGKSA